MRQLKPLRPFRTTINMYEHAGPDEAGVKLRDANWLSGVVEQHPASKWGNTHKVTLKITYTFTCLISFFKPMGDPVTETMGPITLYWRVMDKQLEPFRVYCACMLLCAFTSSGSLLHPLLLMFMAPGNPPLIRRSVSLRLILLIKKLS